MTIQDRIDALAPLVSEERLELFQRLLPFRTRHLTVALENIYQSHNASAVLRTCDCFGIQDVHIIENTNEYTVNPQVALGASKWLDLHKYNATENNTPACIASLKEQGYQVIATTPHTNDVLLDELPITQKTALLFGTEGPGLTQEAMDLADGFVKIPMYGFTESYNISVSAALVMHHLSEKMRKSDIAWQLSEEESNAILLDWLRSTVKKSAEIEARLERNQG